ncbi:MAG: D-aminoacyl-tRNA deacylase [Candidatus Methanomethylophilaceae archaeon]|nr:D-aminoacyl-tRNA deacylase [Candidatus Methanomethylophilaceae archaeon]
MSIPDMHIRHEDLDREIQGTFRPDEVVVMSKHSAKSGQPALTAHPIGNYHENQYGGREGALVRPAPAAMTDALRRIVAYNDMEGTQICFEVTHHGPWLEIPTFFIEIGSDETNWGNMHAAEVLAKVLSDLDPDYEARKLVGVGGGHYAPRFTEVALRFRVSFGHMLPSYQTEGRDDEDVARMVRLACEATGTDSVYVHRKSMKKPEERRITAIIQSLGYETVTSADLDPLSES